MDTKSRSGPLQWGPWTLAGSGSSNDGCTAVGSSNDGCTAVTVRRARHMPGSAWCCLVHACRFPGLRTGRKPGKTCPALDGLLWNREGAAWGKQSEGESEKSSPQRTSYHRSIKVELKWSAVIVPLYVCQTPSGGIRRLLRQIFCHSLLSPSPGRRQHGHPRRIQHVT